MFESNQHYECVPHLFPLQSMTNRRTVHHLVSMVHLSFKADLVPEIRWLLADLNLSVGDLVTTNSRFRPNNRHLSRVITATFGSGPRTTADATADATHHLRCYPTECCCPTRTHTPTASTSITASAATTPNEPFCWLWCYAGWGLCRPSGEYAI